MLRNPISLLLKENQLGPKAEGFYSKWPPKTGGQLEQTDPEILDLRKLEIGKMALDEKTNGTGAFLPPALCAKFESLAERKQIDFSFKILTDKGHSGQSRPGKVPPDLYNLLSNAFKFTPLSGQIRPAWL